MSVAVKGGGFNPVNGGFEFILIGPAPAPKPIIGEVTWEFDAQVVARTMMHREPLLEILAALRMDPDHTPYWVELQRLTEAIR